MTEPLLRSGLFTQHGLYGLFTQRHGGVSPPPFNSFNFGSDLGDPQCNIDRNMQQLLATGALPATPHQMVQVHGNDYHLLNGPGKMHNAEADILLATQPGTAIAVRTADCLPILLADPQTGVIAAVHAGWRGTAASVVAHAVKAMLQYGAERERIIASLGPCIGPCCFKIGKESAQQLAACCSDTATCIIEKTSETYADLAVINRLQLLQSGLNRANIEHLEACTACDAERYFSYRRDGGRTGRHLAVVGLPARP